MASERSGSRAASTYSRGQAASASSTAAAGPSGGPPRRGVQPAASSSSRAAGDSTRTPARSSRASAARCIASIASSGQSAASSVMRVILSSRSRVRACVMRPRPPSAPAHEHDDHGDGHGDRRATAAHTHARDAAARGGPRRAADAARCRWRAAGSRTARRRRPAPGAYPVQRVGAERLQVHVVPEDDVGVVAVQDLLHRVGDGLALARCRSGSSRVERLRLRDVEPVVVGVRVLAVAPAHDLRAW